MLEHPQRTDDGTNFHWSFPSAQSRTLVLSNAGVAAALVKLKDDKDNTIDASNFDVAIPAGETIFIHNVSIQEITAANTVTIGVSRFI